jgi:acetyltransferase-like isoleucine patch superfamily enzyme
VLVHPTAQIGGVTNYFGDGTIITAGCILTTGIILGEFVIINLSTTIGHDVKAGSFCSVMPGCSVSGSVQFEEGCYLGTGVKLVQGITLGKYCKVGAGSVVTKSFEGGVIVGVPARKIK